MNTYDNYDYVITKPELNEETLAHYGIEGMSRKGGHKYISKTKKNGKWHYVYKIAKKAADDATRDYIKNMAKNREESARVSHIKRKVTGTNNLKPNTAIQVIYADGKVPSGDNAQNYLDKKERKRREARARVRKEKVIYD